MEIDKNYSGLTFIDSNATVYKSCNFSNTLVDPSSPSPVDISFNTTKQIRFIDCNLTNVRVPVGSICVRCNSALIHRFQDRVVVYGYTDQVTGEVILRQTPAVKQKQTIKTVEVEMTEQLKAQIDKFLNDATQETPSQQLLDYITRYLMASKR